MTGKLADTVMSVRNGEQLARKYQPIVFNPSTAAQVAQRAKLKLLSQLSAVMAPVIAIRREGPISARNLFTKVNFPKTTFAADTAEIDLPNVSLTNGIVGFIEPTTSEAAGGTGVKLSGSISSSTIDRVVYVLFEKMADKSLRLIGSAVASDAGEGNTWPAVIAGGVNNGVLYAYGVRDNTDAARVAFGDMEAPTAQSIANLVASRTLTESDVTLTVTKGINIVSNRRDDDTDNKKNSSK